MLSSQANAEIQTSTLTSSADIVSLNSLSNRDGSVSKTSQSSSSGEEDGLGTLVIDTDEDTDRASRESKPFYGFQNDSGEGKSPVRNNNNNNSVSRSHCNNNHIGNVEKDSSANKSLFSNNNSKLTPPPQTTGFAQSGKIVKTKSKKSAKSNKSHTSTIACSGATSVTNSRASSPNASFIDNPLDTELNSNVDSKMLTSRTSSSPDESNGKKTKSSKSKSHKKHSKHNEKSSSISTSLGSGKSDLTTEKSKSKSRASAASSSVCVPSTFSSFASSRDLWPCASSSPSNSGLPEKHKSEQYQSGGHKFSDPMTSQSTSFGHKANQSAHQSRLPARTALIAGTTGNGAKSAHAYSYREPSERDACVNQNQHSRKKHKKTQSASSSSQHSSIASASEETPLPRNYFQSSSASTGKRERACTGSSNSTVTGNEISKPKKIKTGHENKGGNSRASSSTAGLSFNYLDQSSNFELTDDGNSSEIRSKNLDTFAGNNSQSAGVKSVAPMVFAPSSHFATTIPRLTTSTTNELSTTSGSSINSPKQSLAGDYEMKDAITSNTNSQRTVGTVTTTADVGVMTQPDGLGPCEPGTTVHLEGIVWQETDTGVLAVNVTWRNRTYVGTLLDATKHDWAPPRFLDTDLEMELRGKNSRPKRSRGGQNENSRKGRSRGSALSASDDIKSSPSAAAKRRSKYSESEPHNTDNDGPGTPRSSAKRLRLATSRGVKDTNQHSEEAKAEANTGSGSSSCSSPIFLECPHPQCCKRYRDTEALQYHQSYAHSDSSREEQKYEEEQKKEEEQKEDQNDEKEQKETKHEARTASPKFSDGACHNLPDVGSCTLSEHKKFDVPKLAKADETCVDNVVKADLKPKCSEENKVFPFEISHPHQSLSKEYSHHGAEIYPVPRSSFPTNPVLLNLPQQPSSESAEERLSYPNTIRSLSNSFVPSLLPQAPPESAASSSAKASHVTSSDCNEADIEKAEAVQFLLKSQHNDDPLFPGLSSYSQDSPHPTLTLGARALTASQHDRALPSQGQPPPRLYQAARYPPAASNEQRGHPAPVSVAHTVASQSYHPVSSTQPEVFSLPPSSSMTHSSPILSNLHPLAALASVAEKNPPGLSSEFIQKAKDNYTLSVSGSCQAAGPKVAKGKTVPIPEDPNQGFQAAYDGSASHSNFNVTKKMKRRKKPEEKTDDNSESPKPSNPTLVSVPDQTSSSFISDGALPPKSVPHGGSVVEPSPPLLKNAGQSSDGSESVSSGPTPDSNRRVLSQLNVSAGRKFPGIISPVSSSQTSNITVTGTFHPHPDPHKPQTAVSAQAQDRLRALRSSPPPSNNKNNNNKLPGSYGGAVCRSPHLSFSKPRPSSGPPEAVQSDRSCYSEQEVPLPRAKRPEIKSHQQEFSINRMQNQVESEIENVYSKELTSKSRSMTSHPVSGVERVRDSPIPGPRPVDRPYSSNDDVKNTPQKNFPRSTDHRAGFDEAQDNRMSTPSPRSKAIAESQRGSFLPILNHAVPHLMHLGAMGYLPPQLMDPSFSALAAQQFVDPQSREMYERYMQDYHQHLLHQQALTQLPQPVDQKQHKPTSQKDVPKQPLSQKKPFGNCPQQTHSKRPQTPTSPPQQQFVREKTSSANYPSSGLLQSSASQSVYKYSQPNALSSQAPSRSHSVAPSNPSVDSSRPHHARSESLDRGRLSSKADARLAKNGPFPTVKSEKSPEKTKENYRVSTDNQANNLPPNPVSYYSYPILDRSGFQGVGPYPSGFLIPQPVLPPQAEWVKDSQQTPMSGKQTPPIKSAKDRQSPTRYRISSKEDIKPKDLGPHFVTKDARTREASDSVSDRKLMSSMELKPDVTSSANPRKSSSSSAVSSEIPTQMHHHTHHHIHGGVLLPQFYPGPPVLGGEGVSGYSVPFQKR